MVVKDVPNLFGLSVFYFDAYSFSFSHNVYYFYFFTLRGGSGGECIGLDVFKARSRHLSKMDVNNIGNKHLGCVQVYQ